MRRRGLSLPPARRKTAEPTRSLEERLHAVRQGCRLLSDVFELLAQAAALDAPFRMSGQGCNVLADLCGTFADDLDEALKGSPGEIANRPEGNWQLSTTARTDGRSREVTAHGGSLRQPSVDARAQGGSRPHQRRAQRAKS